MWSLWCLIVRLWKSRLILLIRISLLKFILYISVYMLLLERDAMTIWNTFFILYVGFFYENRYLLGEVSRCIRLSSTCLMECILLQTLWWNKTIRSSFRKVTIGWSLPSKSCSIGITQRNTCRDSYGYQWTWTPRTPKRPHDSWGAWLLEDDAL